MFGRRLGRPPRIPPFIKRRVDGQTIGSGGCGHELPKSDSPCARFGGGPEAAFDENHRFQVRGEALLPQSLTNDGTVSAPPLEPSREHLAPLLTRREEVHIAAHRIV